MKEEFADLINDFKEENGELLNSMEEALLEIQEKGMSDENISAVFRAAHTIKGSCGMFELDYLVKFTHVAENLLDEIRKKRIVMSEPILNLYFEVKDQLEALITWALANEAPPSGDLEQNSKYIMEQLNNFLNGGGASQTPPKDSAPKESAPQAPEATPVQEVHAQEVVPSEPASTAPTEAVAGSNEYKISIKFFGNAIASGIDPMEFIKTLKLMGTVSNMRTDLSEVPDIMSFATNDAHLKFSLGYQTNKSSDEIRKIFEFAKDFCAIEIEEVCVQPATVAPQVVEVVATAPIKEDETQPVVQAQAAPVATPKPSTEKPNMEKPQEAKTAASLRVEAHKIDTLINLIGEMVIANSNVVQQIATRGDKELMESVSVVSRMLEEIREASMQTRMVPIGETFSRFKRIVRDLSKDLNKDIELDIIGCYTELDKTVREKIYDPLIHLVRNSLDHGIEMPDVRRANGKSATGKLVLKAFHEAGSIAIQIVDDGKGLDPAVLRAKAVEKGLLEADNTLSDKEAFNLIMMAGFSTAEKVSNISGRGVGMDVVRRNIEELRGTIELDSEVGKGTKITIRLPLTLAIIDGFLTRVGDTFYVVPLDMIVECIELTRKQVDEMRANNYINLRGSILPLLDLREFFETKRVHSKRENIVIVRFGEQTVGIIVNELHGEFQTVIKPIGAVFKNVKGIGGATILGSGEVAMILDIPMLLQSVNKLNMETE